jgi:transcriptional regulator with XRE-family HTH domain
MGTSRQSPPSPELKIFSDRLQEAIKFKKIDIVVLAKESEYKPDDINKLLAGMKEPGFKKLILLANSLGCSVDYLLGITPRPQRASVVVEADTDAIKHQPNERGQTSGQCGQFVAMIPKLLESDIELLMHLAGFLIERKEKRLAKFMGALTEKPSSVLETVLPKKDDGLTGNDLDELWDDIEDDEFEDDDLEEDDFGEDDDFEDEDEDDFDDD